MFLCIYTGIHISIHKIMQRAVLVPYCSVPWMFIISISSNESCKYTVGRRCSFWKGSHVNPSRTSWCSCCKIRLCRFLLFTCLHLSEFCVIWRTAHVHIFNPKSSCDLWSIILFLWTHNIKGLIYLVLVSKKKNHYEANVASWSKQWPLYQDLWILVLVLAFNHCWTFVKFSKDKLNKERRLVFNLMPIQFFTDCIFVHLPPFYKV